MCIVQNGLNGQHIIIFILFSVHLFIYGLHVCYRKLTTFSISSARDLSIFVNTSHKINIKFCSHTKICKTAGTIPSKNYSPLYALLMPWDTPNTTHQLVLNTNVYLVELLWLCGLGSSQLGDFKTYMVILCFIVKKCHNYYTCM